MYRTLGAWMMVASTFAVPMVIWGLISLQPALVASAVMSGLLSLGAGWLLYNVDER